MRIENLMSRQVRTCTPADTLNTATNVMWEHDCGVVPVVDQDGRPVGMVTDRDICMAAFFHGATLSELSVSAVMARELCTLKAGDSVHDALELMRERQLRRLPVVDDAGALVGLLSVADVAAAWSRRLVVDGRELRDDDVALTLSAISRDRRESPRTVMVVEISPPARAAAAAAPEVPPAMPKRPARKRKTSGKAGKKA